MQNKSKNKILLLIIIIILTVGLFYVFLKQKNQNNIISLLERVNPSKSIKIQFLSNEKLNIINSKFTVSLYGYDQSLADVPATLITEEVYNETSVPFSIILPYPKNSISLIEKQNGQSVKKAYYYITTEWDSNNDGSVNSKGDIFLDDDNVSLMKIGKQKLYLMQL